MSKVIFIKCEEKLFEQFKNSKLLMQVKCRQSLNWVEYFEKLMLLSTRKKNDRII